MLTLLEVALVLEGRYRSLISAQYFKLWLLLPPHGRHVAVLVLILRHPVDTTAVVVWVLRSWVKVLNGQTASSHVHFVSLLGLRSLLEALSLQFCDYLVNLADLSV